MNWRERWKLYRRARRHAHEVKLRERMRASNIPRMYGDPGFTDADQQRMWELQDLEEDQPQEHARRERVKEAFFVSGYSTGGMPQKCRECGWTYDIGYYCWDTEPLLEHVATTHADVDLDMLERRNEWACAERQFCGNMALYYTHTTVHSSGTWPADWQADPVLAHVFTRD